MSVFNQVIASENNKELKAYVAAPPSGKGPGIILMHEVYGVTKGLKELADKLAEDGFVVACPNMYWRDNPDASFKYDPPPEVMAAMPEDERKKLNAELAHDRDAARDCMFSAMEDPRSTEKIIDTINKVSAYLRSRPDCTGAVAASGFCFGARNTYLAVVHGADVDAGVAFYPTPKLFEVFDREATMNARKPLMFVVGGEDPYINDDEKEDMIVASSGKIITYVSGRKKPIVEQNSAGNPNIMALYYANSNHGFNRRESKYSDSGTSDHVLRAASEFLKAALVERKFAVPSSALNATPASPTYHPQHKV